MHKKAIEFLGKAYKSKRSYWSRLRAFEIKPYDFRRIFEFIYNNLRSHEIDLLQGRLATELTIHYTPNLEEIVERVLEVQENLLKKIK